MQLGKKHHKFGESSLKDYLQRVDKKFFLRCVHPPYIVHGLHYVLCCFFFGGGNQKQMFKSLTWECEITALCCHLAMIKQKYHYK